VTAKPPLGPTRRRRRLTNAPPNPLAPYWRLLDSQPPPWWNHGVMFGGPSKTVAIEGIRWLLTFNIHVTRKSRRSRPYATAGLSVVPASVSDMQRKRIRRGQWVRALLEEMKRHGYFGGWRDSRWGGAAMFYKELPSLALVRTELAQVSRYEVPSVLRKWAGRRTTR